MKHKYNIFLFFILFFLCMPFYAQANETIIMIDPGHGGKNLGAEYKREDNNALYWEKDMTLITALAMKEELEKYDNVTVYLTREADVEEDITLKNRILAAKEKNASYLISLHYNMSVSHILYGSEVWIPSTGSLYSNSASLATEFMNEFDGMGLFHRGIKTRLNEKGTDYYGILRNATEQNINAMIVEHCHLDNLRDYKYYGTQDLLKEFGRRDATAVAKYFGLTSSQYGYDYSTYAKTEFAIPSSVVAPDITEPDLCEISLLNYDKDNGTIALSIQAGDIDSTIFYYSYSYDNGQTYSPLLEWGDNPSVEVSFQVEEGTTPRVMVKVYNGYDIFKESNLLVLEPFVKEETEMAVIIDPIVEIKADTINVTKKDPTENFLSLFIICFVIIVLIFAILLSIRIQKNSKNRNRNNRNNRSHKEK